MKKAEVEIGATYFAKVSGAVTLVKVINENPRGGWDGVNITTGRGVRIKSAQRLRRKFVPKDPAKPLASKAEPPQEVFDDVARLIGHRAENDPKKANSHIGHDLDCMCGDCPSPPPAKNNVIATQLDKNLVNQMGVPEPD